MTEAWKRFRYAIERLESSVKSFNYQGAFDLWEPSTLQHWNRLPPESVTLGDIQRVLSEEAIAPPHGFDLLRNPICPDLPAFPEWPKQSPSSHDQWIIEKAQKLRHKIVEIQDKLEKQINIDQESLDHLWMKCSLNDSDAISQLMLLAIARHPLPRSLRAPVEIGIDQHNRIILATIAIPTPNIVKEKNRRFGADWVMVSALEAKRANENILFSLTIRTAYLIACSDVGNWFDTIAVNAERSWDDPATGTPRKGVVASLQALKAEIQSLQISRLDPKSCFRHLKGISTPSIDNVSPIRPIFVMSKDDDRIVESRDVLSDVNVDTNIAVMPWEDFEQLVRQLFELEFGRDGIEVRVTRASRDRGVDAIMFDPDPIRGGKYVLQAKRYTRTVDVASVRDLYGTVMNEGANRGILVTTATFGPDAYEFAKNKPLSLVDGANLIAMLRRHGRSFRIDLDEARRLAVDLE